MNQENRYVIDPESPTELARLLNQERLHTRSMGGLLPEQPHTVRGNVLDLACGPGGWALDLAQSEPQNVHVVGVDISQNMIEYANAQAQVQHLSNVNFRVMDVLKPLDFPDASFDLINLRYATGFMQRTAWPGLLKECMRVLTLGGIMRLTEMESVVTDAPAIERLCLLLTQAVYRVGFGFSELHFATVAMLRRFLTSAGYQEVQERPSMVNTSYGTELYDESYQSATITFALVRPFVLQLEIAAPEEYDRIYDQALQEMRRETFCAVAFMNTAWGKKPE